MKLKVITLRFDPETGGFDDTLLRDFQQGRQVLSVHEHFFSYNEIPLWALLISYRDEEKPGEGQRERDKGKDWRADLSPPERVLYDALRTWRNDRAARDGRPPYILLTNRQMAEIAKKRPSNLETLREVEGIGEAKTAAFGKELIALIGIGTDGDTEGSPQSPTQNEKIDGAS